MNYEVKILSPVHIGTGKNITPFEFAHTHDKFIVMDMDRLLEANPRRVEDLNRRLTQDALHFALSDFLTADELKNAAWWKYCAALDLSTKKVLQEELRKAKNMDVAEQIKTGADAQLYLPGSSLKGAFRTAVAYATLQQNEALLQQLKQRLTKVDWRNPDEAVNDLIFWGAKRDPKYDLFKTLRISDSSTLPANEHTLAIGKMKILSLRSSAKKPASDAPAQRGTMYAQLQALRAKTAEAPPLKFWWTLQEVLTPGIAFQGELEIEQRLLRETNARKILGWKEQQQQFEPQTLIQSANVFARDLCDWELHFFQKEVTDIDVTPVVNFYRKLKTELEQTDSHTCYLCLGQGAGWHKMTVGLLLERAKDFDFNKLRKTLRLAQDRLNFDYPKSRKLLMKSEQEIQAVFGWVKIQFT